MLSCIFAPTARVSVHYCRTFQEPRAGVMGLVREQEVGAVVAYQASFGDYAGADAASGIETRGDHASAGNFHSIWKHSVRRKLRFMCRSAC